MYPRSDPPFRYNNPLTTAYNYLSATPLILFNPSQLRFVQYNTHPKQISRLYHTLNKTPL